MTLIHQISQHAFVCRQVLGHLPLHAHRRVQAIQGVRPTLAGILRHAVTAYGSRVFLRVEPGKFLVNAVYLIGQTLGLGNQTPGGRQCRAQSIHRIEIKPLQIPRLVDQHVRLVLQLLYLIVDLLQGTGRGQHVLRQIRRVEHNIADTKQGLGGLGDSEGNGAGQRHRAKTGNQRAFTVHGCSSREVPAGEWWSSNCAAQSMPRWRSQATAKSATGIEASSASISR